MDFISLIILSNYNNFYSIFYIFVYYSYGICITNYIIKLKIKYICMINLYLLLNYVWIFHHANLMSNYLHICKKIMLEILY